MTDKDWVDIQNAVIREGLEIEREQSKLKKLAVDLISCYLGHEPWKDYWVMKHEEIVDMEEKHTYHFFILQDKEG